MEKRRLELVTDLYEFTMSNALLLHGVGDQIAYFDLFFRSVPDSGGYTINAGLEQLIEFIQNHHYTEDDIAYLKGLNKFSDEFLDFLKNFKFTGDIWAMPEGTVAFPNTPKIIVRAPIIQCAVIETMALLTTNHQSLIATKASRIVHAADGRAISGLGTISAHGPDAAIYGERAALIAGIGGTSCVETARQFDGEAVGTMAHLFVQFFPTEYEAFKVYAETYPDDCVLLVDTYDTLKSGLPNAIKVFKEVIVPQGYRPKGIQLDSGDLAYLSKEARKMLDEAGFPDCKIVASNSLDEFTINSLINQGAKIDIFGVGERLITARSCPFFDGVYKLAAIESEGNIISKIKHSDNDEKITNPGFKTLYRFYEKGTGKAIADLVALYDENIPEDEYTLVDSDAPWRRKVIRDYIVKPLHERIFVNGELVYRLPTLAKIAQNCREDLATIDESIKRFENPHRYFVNLSEGLWRLKQEMLMELNK